MRKEILIHLPKLQAYALSMCKKPDYADDLVQTTVMKAIRSEHLYTDLSMLKAWLFMILRNTYLTDQRRQSLRRRVNVEGFEDEYGMHAGQVEHIELSEVFKCLMALHPEQRAALVAVAIYGNSYGETSKLLGVKEGTIKSRVNRARKVLSMVFETPMGEVRAKRRKKRPKPSAEKKCDRINGNGACAKATEAAPCYPVRVYSAEEIKEFEKTRS